MRLGPLGWWVFHTFILGLGLEFFPKSRPRIPTWLAGIPIPHSLSDQSNLIKSCITNFPVTHHLSD